jgi:hypothetical protein
MLMRPITWIAGQRGAVKARTTQAPRVVSMTI